MARTVTALLIIEVLLIIFTKKCVYPYVTNPFKSHKNLLKESKFTGKQALLRQDQQLNKRYSHDNIKDHQ
jgi:hypothetical protein